MLERSGETIAGHVGMSGVLFGSTLLAGATALPVLFLMASLLSEEAVLPQAQATDIYLTGLGILLTAVYVSGLIFRSRRRVLRMGTDSMVVLILYALGVVGLVAVALGGG